MNTAVAEQGLTSILLKLEQLTNRVIKLENSTKECGRFATVENLGQGRSKREKEWQMLNQHEETADVKFLVGLGAERQEILAHRLILMRQSEEFHTLLLPRQDYYNNPISFEQYQGAEFKAFLKVIYLGILPTSDDVDFVSRIRGILKVSKDFQPDAVPACKFRLETAIKNNWKIALKALEMEEDAEIISEALSTICRNATDIFKSPEFLELPSNYLKEIIKLDELTVGETTIFEALILWAENKIGDSSSMNLEEKGQRIRTEISDLLHLIRFPLMEEEYFVNEVVEMKILNEREEFVITKFMMFSSHSKHSDPAPFACKKRQESNENTEEHSSVRTTSKPVQTETEGKQPQDTPDKESRSTSVPEIKQEFKCEISDSDEFKEPPAKMMKMETLSDEGGGSLNNSISTEEVGSRNGDAVPANIFEDLLEDPVDNPTRMELEVDGSPLSRISKGAPETQVGSGSRNSDISTDGSTALHIIGQTGVGALDAADDKGNRDVDGKDSKDHPPQNSGRTDSTPAGPSVAQPQKEIESTKIPAAKEGEIATKDSIPPPPDDGDTDTDTVFLTLRRGLRGKREGETNDVTKEKDDGQCKTPNPENKGSGTAFDIKMLKLKSVSV